MNRRRGRGPRRRPRTRIGLARSEGTKRVLKRDAARAAIRDFLLALGRDPEREPELAETPARVVEAFADELLTGYGLDLATLVTKDSSPAPANAGLIAVRDIAVATVCPH